MDFFGFIITAIVLLAIGLPVAIIVMFWITRNKTNQLQQQLDELRAQVAALAAGPVAGIDAQSEIVDPISASNAVSSEEPSEPESPEAPPEPEAQWGAPPAAASTIPPAAAGVTHDPGPRAKNPVDHFEDLLRRIGNAATSYFTDGNIFVRIGLLVLFFGVASC
jgi:uncharacterized membrane protein